MTIVSLFPVPLKKLLTDIENLGFSLCLIGGAPRDYLLDRSYLSRDLDFEVRGKTTIELKSFFQSQNITINELPYDIVRVGFLGFDLEFSNPRKEIPLLDNKTHHHFQAILDINFTYEESFKRRDFSLNAIGIELNLKDNKETVIDPFNGVGALQSKTLKEMSDDFFLDSVRFLRLIRFMIKYNFEMSASIQGRLSEFDLSELSVHHFTEEMLKSTKPGIFINAFNNLVSVFYLKVPEKYLFWQSLKFLPDIETIDDLMVDAFLQNENAGLQVAKFFSLPDKRLKDLKSFHESINNISQTPRDEFINLAHMKIEEITDFKILKDLKNLEDKKEWRAYSNDTLLVSWKDWENITVPTHEIEAAPVASRSFIKFHNAIKRVFGNA